MGVRRFRSIEDMKRDRWRTAGDPELVRVLVALWQLGQRTRRHPIRPGVYKHHSVEEAKVLKEAWQRG